MKRASLLVAVLALLAAAAVAAPAAAPAPAFLAVSQPVPEPSPEPVPVKGPCDDFCARAYCVQGTTCGQNPATGKCGCWPDSGLSTGF